MEEDEKTVILNTNDYDGFIDFSDSYDLDAIMKILREMYG